MRLVQFTLSNGTRRVAKVVEGRSLNIIGNTMYVRDLVLDAFRREMGLEELVNDRLSDEMVSYDDVVTQNRLLPPLDHPDPAHCYLSGTGLDHLGSAQARDAMHTKLATPTDELTDSMKMFRLGLEGGKPMAGQIGVQPEWFYKGDGSWLVPPGHDLQLPSFALDGGEEPELVGLYVVADGGQILRVGFALGNEFSDHVLEKQNYLYLAHSKLRQSSFGPEVRLGEPPADIVGSVRIWRGDEELWSAAFHTGQDNMTHSIANIEHHHFKYSGFRRPGDVHCHFFGTATLSFSAGISTQPGDVFEVSAPGFGRALRNPMVAQTGGTSMVSIKTL